MRRREEKQIEHGDVRRARLSHRAQRDEWEGPSSSTTSKHQPLHQSRCRSYAMPIARQDHRPSAMHPDMCLDKGHRSVVVTTGVCKNVILQKTPPVLAAVTRWQGEVSRCQHAGVNRSRPAYEYQEAFSACSFNHPMVEVSMF